MLETKPHLLFFPEAWDVAYTAAAEPPASTPAWTLIGVDHASVTGNVCTIASAGTDQNAYSLAWNTHDINDALWAYVTLQIETGGTTAAVKLASATLGKAVTLTVTGDAVISDGTQSIALNMVTAAQNLLVLLTRGGWRLWSVSSAGVLTYLGTGAGDAEASDSLMTWGKLSTASDNNDQKFSSVKTYVGDSFAFPWQPNKWIGWLYETDKAVNVCHDGTVETIHGRDDRFLTFTQQAVSAAELAEIKAYYLDYMAPGTTFVLAEDQTDIRTGWHLVKLLDKKFDPQQDSAVPTHYQLAWKLREVAA